MARIWTDVFGGEAETRLRNVIASQTGWLGLEREALEAPLYQAEKAGNRAPATAFDAYAITGYFGGVLGLEDNAELVKDWLSESLELAGSTPCWLGRYLLRWRKKRGARD